MRREEAGLVEDMRREEAGLVEDMRKAKRQRGRETERQRDREAERQRDREAERQRDREAERQRGRETERQRDRDTERQRGRETERQRHREAERQRDRDTERQRDRDTERQRGKAPEPLRVGVASPLSACRWWNISISCCRSSSRCCFTRYTSFLACSASWATTRYSFSMRSCSWRHRYTPTCWSYTSSQPRGSSSPTQSAKVRGFVILEEERGDAPLPQRADAAPAAGSEGRANTHTRPCLSGQQTSRRRPHEEVLEHIGPAFGDAGAAMHVSGSCDVSAPTPDL
ncbi:Nipped-B-like protein B [Liparis tanakae]|uniref:Nipped-B-like protein B n=1 Tax=Liparis tanakae TaxID=230148 RepID=A0A4Z2FHK8_9TELE|nr:Nipped-B-like protein B [Liparis tanakae]